jgi:alpha-tubulin suppressor-like RCC1 family protein
MSLVVRAAVLVLAACSSLGCTRSQPSSGTGAADASAVAPPPSQSTHSNRPAARSAAPTASVSAQAPTRLTESRRLCVGGGHTCFVDAKHSLWCWGGNTYGQVGNGTHGFGGRTEDTNLEHDIVKKPTRVAALEGKVKAVGCGTQNSCALTLDGAIYCWGSEENPKRTEILSDVPVLREIGGKALAIALKSDHACAIREDGTLWCWGSNYNGQLGAGPPAPGAALRYAPATQVKMAGNDITDVAVFEEGTCVLKRGDSALWCWGRNREGEVGDGSYEKRVSPVRVAGLEKVLGFATGKTHVCAIREGGLLSCWGRNYEGQLGNGQTPKTKPVNYATPQAVSHQFNGIRALDLGYSETLVVDAAGDLYAFGDLSSMGRGGEPDSTPRRVPLPAPVIEARANFAHRCALLADDSVWCWGNGEEYALGTGNDASAKAPVRVVFPK